MIKINFREGISSDSQFIQQCPSCILDRLKQRLGYSESEINKAWIELQRFLFACSQTNESLAPSSLIDEIWHEAILNTRYYAELCSTLCGHFIHHIPTSNSDGESSSYKRTLALLTKIYGRVDAKYWPPHSLVLEGLHECGSCGASCAQIGFNFPS